MKQWVMVCCVWGAALCAEEDDCFCGTVPDDPFYSKAIVLLNLSVQHMFLSNLEHSFPSAANAFHPPIELRESLDDTYPLQGHISWNVITRRYGNKKLILGHDDGLDPEIVIPLKLARKLEIDPPGGCQRKAFVFHKNYAAISQAFDLLKDDIAFYYEQDERFLDARMQDLRNKIPVYECGTFYQPLAKKKGLLEKKKQSRLEYNEQLRFTSQKESEALVACMQSLEHCITTHHNPAAYLNRGLFYYLEGNSLDAFGLAEAALGKLSGTDFTKLKEEALLLKSQTELETGLYADAVITLSDLIKQNPGNKEVYFERAGAYFELGNFDLSLEDYLISHGKHEPIPIETTEWGAFSLGLAQGIVQGGIQAGAEFIPSVLSSLQGINQGLWAFAQDPVQVSKEFIQASQDCIYFIKDHTLPEALVELVPELQELIAKWDQLEHEKKGALTGLIIGKYGIDIFIGAGFTKAMKSFRELRRANNRLTFEAMAISERNHSLIKLEATKRARARQEILENRHLKIQSDKQGKHLVHHKNYNPSKNKSILEHPDPQRLIDEFAGKGMKAQELPPGTPGYQELVNFKEFIGYDINQETGAKIATSWGKIHYAQDGVHIVPTRPRWP